MDVMTTVCLLLRSEASADLASKLDTLVGYTIVASKAIRGWYDSDEKEEGAFKGCRHGRVIVFTDFKMIVEDEVYDMLRKSENA